MTPTHHSNIRACPVCGKMVNRPDERHTMFHCRNYLLKQLYQEANPSRRTALQERIDALNERLSLKGQNLLDT